MDDYRVLESRLKVQHPTPPNGLNGAHWIPAPSVFESDFDYDTLWRSKHKNKWSANIVSSTKKAKIKEALGHAFFTTKRRVSHNNNNNNNNNSSSSSGKHANNDNKPTQRSVSMPSWLVLRKGNNNIKSGKSSPSSPSSPVRGHARSKSDWSDINNIHDSIKSAGQVLNSIYDKISSPSSQTLPKTTTTTQQQQQQLQLTSHHTTQQTHTFLPVADHRLSPPLRTGVLLWQLGLITFIVWNIGRLVGVVVDIVGAWTGTVKLWVKVGTFAFGLIGIL